MGERRRIRDKTAVKKIDSYGRDLDDQPCEQMDERRGERLKRPLLEEGYVMMADREEVMEIVFEIIKTLKGDLPAPEEDVLRTRIVSLRQLQAEKDLWDQAIGRSRRRSSQRLYPERVEVVPSKIVATLKSGPRRKIRWVACSKYVEKQDPE